MGVSEGLKRGLKVSATGNPISVPVGKGTLGRIMDVLGAPQDFLASPLRWMRWLSEHGGTATAGPNFAWVLATRALRNLRGETLARQLFDQGALR